MRRALLRAGLAALAVGVPLVVAGLAAGPVGAAQPTPTPITDFVSYPQPGLIPAGCAAEGNRSPAPDIITGLQFAIASGPAAGTYGDLSGVPATLPPGTVITMTWDGYFPGCEEAGIGFAVKQSDVPVFDIDAYQTLMNTPEQYDYCGQGGVPCPQLPDGRFGPLTVTIPTLSESCAYQLDAFVGPALASVGRVPNGSFYSPGSRGDDGPSLLVSARNGGFPCQRTTTVDKQWVIDGVLGPNPPADLPPGFTITVISRSNLGVELGRATSTDGGVTFSYTNVSGNTASLDVAVDGSFEVLESPAVPGDSVTQVTSCADTSCQLTVVNDVTTTTSTTSSPSTTSVTVLPTTVVPTTVAPSTTTTFAVSVLPTTVVASTTVARGTATPTTAAPVGTLPRTGANDTEDLVALGAALMVVGLSLLLISRGRHPATEGSDPSQG